MQIISIEDIAGDDVAHQVAALATQAKWIQWIVGGIGTVRIGDSHVSLTRGFPIPAGGGEFFPPIAEIGERYSLNQIYYLIPTGATLSISYAA